MDEAGELELLVTRWQAAYKRATDFDAWGQPVEAIDVYQRLSRQMHHYAGSEDSTFTDHQKKTLEKIAVCLDSRQRALQAQKPGQVAGVSLHDLKMLESTLKDILGNTSKEDFPLDVCLAQVQLQRLIEQRGNNGEERQEKQVRGNLLPRPLPVAGMTLLTIHIEQIGLKDASEYIDPFITVSVKDCHGHDLTVSQDTPLASEKSDSCLVFNVDVHILKTIESLPPGFAVFFELKHFKPKKHMVSTRCWACLEKDEIKEGPAALELYKKPTDYRRKNISLLTVKPLYLHVRLQLFR